MKSLREHSHQFAGSLALETVLRRSTMSLLREIFFWATALLIASAFVAFFFLPKASLAFILLGVAAITGTLWVEQLLLFAYHNSFFFHGLNSIIGLDHEPVSGVTYEVAKITLRQPEDITAAFCTSTLGSVVLLRTGIPFSDIDAALSAPRTLLRADELLLPESELFTMHSLGLYLLTHDPIIKTLLKQQGLSDATYISALKWVISAYHEEKRSLRWWSKDNLSKTEGIGREWGFGTAFLLEQYSRNIQTTAVFSTLTANAAYAEEKITEIETALARSRSANALIIGEPGVGKMDLVMAVKRRIELGQSLDAISGKQIVALDTNRLFASNREKSDLEYTLLSLFSEAYHSGNLVIVIENISTVVREAQAAGVFLPELLDEFLASSTLQIIATDTPAAFHSHLEPLGAFVQRFAEVLIEVPDLETTIRVLQAVTPTNEYRHRVLFTYGALEAIATAADRYLVEGDMPDKAITLLVSVATEAGHANQEIIGSDFVYKVVEAMTGIPAGPVTEGERDLLLHLEERLHTQVIGQDKALSAIARTMRRARVGIQANDKPIGSFLFLGPTGVGKTEAAKALANIFFGSEASMQRLDMSEYSGPDALARLIGDGEVSGTLPDLLQEHPYTVLLLDEFEKAARTVHDLFLQILDEGIFTDARGTKVNARNTIIIATSNAGSQLILKTVEQRQELASLSQEIINHIIQEGHFRPELINRFSSTVIFEPLTMIEQGRVAKLMLGNLYERIREKGYDLTISNDLLDLLVEKGYSPEFGARPMQRVLQDVIEEAVAIKIISGEVQKGDRITLTPADINAAELAV